MVIYTVDSVFPAFRTIRARTKVVNVRYHDLFVAKHQMKKYEFCVA